MTNAHVDLEARLRALGERRDASAGPALAALLASAAQRATPRSADPRLPAAAVIGVGFAALVATQAVPSPADAALDGPLVAALREAFEPLEIPTPDPGAEDR